MQQSTARCFILDILEGGTPFEPCKGMKKQGNGSCQPFEHYAIPLSSRGRLPTALSQQMQEKERAHVMLRTQWKTCWISCCAGFDCQSQAPGSESYISNVRCGHHYICQAILPSKGVQQRNAIDSVSPLTVTQCHGDRCPDPMCPHEVHVDCVQAEPTL